MVKAEHYRQSMLGDNNFRKLGRYFMWNEIEMDTPQMDSLIEFLIKNKTFVTPTLGAFEYKSMPEQHDTILFNGFKRMMDFTGKLGKAGIQVVVGSHGRVTYAEEGWAFQHEMELINQSGLSAMDVIVGATLRNAKFFRIEDRLGSIEEGKQADLILVEGDPLLDIRAMFQVKKVMLNGVWVK